MGTIICRHDRLRRQCYECDMSEEIAQLRADIARMDRALADERAAVAIAHERMDALAAERDDFRKRINEIRAHVPEEWDGDSGDFAGTVVAILSCPHGEPGHYWKDGCPECCAVEHEALRANAAGSGNGGDDA